jgi:hypothetical protein
MLNSGKKIRALRDKKNKYSNSCVVRKKNSERNKTPPLQVKWSVPYGIEIVLPSGKNMECLQMYFKKLIKQLSSLPDNIADISMYILSGLLPIEAEIHLKVLSLFGNITQVKRSSVEWKLADRVIIEK